VGARHPRKKLGGLDGRPIYFILNMASLTLRVLGLFEKIILYSRVI